MPWKNPQNLSLYEQAQKSVAAAMSLDRICNSTFGFIGSDLNARVILQTDRGNGIFTTWAALFNFKHCLSNFNFKLQLKTSTSNDNYGLQLNFTLC